MTPAVPARILVLGGGGREHALCLALKKCASVGRLYCAPGSDGIAGVAECLPDLLTTHVEGIVAFAKTMEIDLVVVGPEAPLVAGLADLLRAAGIPCFGPGKEGAQLEGSKSWAKSLMIRNNIPTAVHHTFTSADDAKGFCTALESYPTVVKADGLAAGKGVTVCFSRAEAHKAISEAMEQRRFGEAGGTLIIEEFLRGEEVSVHAVTDGDTLLILPSAQDHKRIRDGDEGPNTGGMGAYSPAPILTEKLLDTVVRTILVPILHALRRENIEYRGVLYAGLMLTRSGPKVIEWNCRFGDPETQVILPRLRGDLGLLLRAAAEGKLDEIEGVDVDPRPVVGVVLASEGYPDAYKQGKPITGVEAAAGHADVTVLHAGTRKKDGEWQTSGGRVLTVAAAGKDFVDARDRAYRAIAEIRFDGEQHRSDIGKRAIDGPR